MARLTRVILDTLLHPQFDQTALKNAVPIGKALGASPGAACGKIVFSADDAKEWADRGEKVVLVRLETSPEDIEGMKAAQGILTVRGGMTSMQRLWPVVWVNAVYLDAAISSWMKRINALPSVAKNITKVMLFP